MIERKQPYVGVSGVVNPEQQREIIEMTTGMFEYVPHRLALGVKATHKPQYDDIENKYGRQWYPVGEEISGAMDSTLETYNIAQMYYEPEALSGNPFYAKEFTDQVARRTGSYIDALQVDMLRFDTDRMGSQRVISAMAATGLDTIIQCHGHAMNLGPKAALNRLKHIADGERIDYILFDASHGRGITMNPDALLPFIEAAHNDQDFADTGTNFGVAGGLSGDAVSLLTTIAKEFPGVSWDAEGKLHDAIAEGGDGSLNMARVRQYLSRSASLLELTHENPQRLND